jgi:hypothetical protein
MFTTGDEYTTWIAHNPPIRGGIVTDRINRSTEQTHATKTTWRVMDESGRAEIVERKKYLICWVWDRTRDVMTWRFVKKAEIGEGVMPYLEYADSEIDVSEAVELYSLIKAVE